MNIKTTLRTQYDRIRASGFLKSVLTLSSGVVVAQAINFFGMPVVGRVYTPSAIGDYTLITTNAGVISSLACLGMMTAFMLPEKNEEARGLSRLVTYSTVTITTLAILGLWLCSGFYRIFSMEETPYSISLLVLWLYIVFNTVSNICYAYVNRQKLYRVMFWNPVFTAGINVGCGILFGWLGWGFVGYTGAHILSFLVNILHLIRHANPFEKISDPAYRCIPLLKSYRRFPIYQMPANLVSSLATRFPAQMLDLLFSSAALGMYSMALRILSLPTMLLATPINRVYFQEANQRYNRGEDIGEFSFKILETNIKLAILPVSLFIVFGEWIFALFLGEQWREAGTFAAVLGLCQLMRFCASCLSGDFVIIRRNRIELGMSLFRFAANASLYFLTIWLHLSNLFLCLTLLSTVEVLSELIQRGIFLKLTGFSLSRYLLFVVKYICLPVGAAWLIRLLIW